jgi:hypothetical protein
VSNRESLVNVYERRGELLMYMRGEGSWNINRAIDACHVMKN